MHSDQEAYWNHIGKTIFDINDNEHFVILTVCTCNKHEGLFYKYIDSMKYESYKVKKDDDICEYSPCEELLDSNSYEFVDGKVLYVDFTDVLFLHHICITFSLYYQILQRLNRAPTEYEQLREDNIRRNAAFLQGLGLQSDSNSSSAQINNSLKVLLLNDFSFSTNMLILGYTSLSW